MTSNSVEEKEHGISNNDEMDDKVKKAINMVQKRFGEMTPDSLLEKLQKSTGQINDLAVTAFEINVRGGLCGGVQNNQYKSIYLTNKKWNQMMGGFDTYKDYLGADNFMILKIFRDNSYIISKMIKQLSLYDQAKANNNNNKIDFKHLDDKLANCSHFKNIPQLWTEGMFLFILALTNIDYYYLYINYYLFQVLMVNF